MNAVAWLWLGAIEHPAELGTALAAAIGLIVFGLARRRPRDTR